MQQQSQPRFVYDANNRPYRSVMIRSANGGPFQRRLIPAGRLGQGPRIFKIATHGTTYVRHIAPPNRTPTSAGGEAATSDTPPAIDLEVGESSSQPTASESQPRVAFRSAEGNNGEPMYFNRPRVVRHPIRIVSKNGAYGYHGGVPPRFSNGGVVNRNGRVLPFRPVYHSSVNRRRPLEFEESEEEAILRAIEHEEARMQQEALTVFYDPEFQRIEANLVKRAQSTAREIETNRFSKLTSYQSRSVMPSEIDVKVKQIVQKMMNDPSSLALNTSDAEDVVDIKMTLNSVVDRVCQQDKIEGWHRSILKRIRRQPDPPVLHPQVVPRRAVQKHAEVLLNERVDIIRRHITKRRARFELDVELENYFVKRTRSGAISCVPNQQIFNRISAFIEEEPLIPEATPELSPATPQDEYYYPNQTKTETSSNEYRGYFNQDTKYEGPENDNLSAKVTTNTVNRSASCKTVEDIKTGIVRHSPRQPVKSSKYTSSPIDMAQPPFVPGSTSINRIPRLIQSIKPAGVAIISAKKHHEFRKAKPGRPSNKEKRRLERKAAAELKKMSKRPPKHPTDEIDMNACHCMCRKPFDVKKFYLACNKCFRWFHGRCVGLTEKRASRMTTWECPECNPSFIIKQPSRRQALVRANSQSNNVNTDFADEEMYEVDPEPPEDIVNDYIYPRSLYCICRREYIETEFYVGCEYCDNWFHPLCVGITRATAEKMDEYVCPNCTLSDSNVIRLTPKQHRLVFNAIVALFKVPGNELFRRDTEAGRPYRDACPNFPVIEEFCHRHSDFAFATLDDFCSDLDAFEAAVHSFFGNRSHHGLTASKMVRIAKRRLQSSAS